MSRRPSGPRRLPRLTLRVRSLDLETGARRVIATAADYWLARDHIDSAPAHVRTWAEAVVA